MRAEKASQAQGRTVEMTPAGTVSQAAGTGHKGGELAAILELVLAEQRRQSALLAAMQKQQEEFFTKFSPNQHGPEPDKVFGVPAPVMVDPELLLKLAGLPQAINGAAAGIQQEIAAVRAERRKLAAAGAGKGQKRENEPVIGRYHGGNGAEGVKAGGVFIGAEVAGVGHVAGPVCAALAMMKCLLVGVISHDDKVGDVALLLFAGHEAQNGVGDLLLVELGLAGLVEITGGGAKLLVAQIIERLVNGGGAAA